MRRMRRSHRRTDRRHRDRRQPAGAAALFTIKRIADADGGVGRLTTASGSLTCDFRLTDFASRKPLLMQVLSIDDCARLSALRRVLT